jgi:type I restriction enzyme S subunit
VKGLTDYIAQQCPGGVPTRTLAEVGTFLRGNGLQKADFTMEGVGCIHYGQIYTHYGTVARSTKSFVSAHTAAKLKKAQTGDLIVATTSETEADVCKAVAWLGDAPVAIGGHSSVFRHDLDPRYVAYYFQTESFQAQKRKLVSGTKVKDIRLTDLGRISIPVPPLQVQRRIADVLTLMEDLRSELEAEVKARSLQAAAYREERIGRSTAERHPLGALGQFERGRRFTKADLAKEGTPAIHYADIYTTLGVEATATTSFVRSDYAGTLRYASPGDVVMASVGETVADVGQAVAWLGQADVAIHDDSFRYRSQQLDPTYVSYFMRTEDCKYQKVRHVAQAKVKRINAAGLGELEIPLPALSEQRRIVEVLRTFDALLYGKDFGLPAEIAARGRQFAHYRDALLAFQRTAA